MDIYEEKLKKQKEILRCLKENKPLIGTMLEITIKAIDICLSRNCNSENFNKSLNDIRTKIERNQTLSEYEIHVMDDLISSIDYEERQKERKSRGASYGHIKRRIKKNEPLTGKTLELALDLVDVPDDGSDFAKFLRAIADKMKAGELLSDYESHIMIDVMLLHARLG